MLTFSEYDGGKPLSGGNMSAPVRVGDTVRRKKTASTPLIHGLLRHVRKRGVDFVPRPLGFDEKGREVLSYISGEVPHDMPVWIWGEDILTQIARAARVFHDASCAFDPGKAVWQLPAHEPSEVICHNDFAPYNCVFQDRRFKGLIDFDMCSPGPRIWELAYSAYRFVPVMPTTGSEPHFEVSPFPLEKIKQRCGIFLKAYAGVGGEYRYSFSDLFLTISKRLEELAKWTFEFGKKANNQGLVSNARMYTEHKVWADSMVKDPNSA